MMNYLKKKELQPWLIVYIIIGISMIMSFVVEPQLQSYLGNSKLYPGSKIPWYFIQRDFIASLSSIIGVLISLPLIYVAYKRFKIEWSPAVFFLFMSYLTSIYRGLIIFIYAGNVLNINKAKVAWPTFDSYMAEKSHYGWLLFLIITVLLFVNRQRKLQKRHNKVESAN